jgi:DNA (cytosine-5)-methyltransferase 1
VTSALTVGGEFDGIGLLAYGLHLAGLEHRWLCEVDPWRRGILARRFPGVPVFDDVRAVGARSAERVDVIAGGFPCKGASTAGKRTGFDHPETVLWREMARTVGELRPRYVLVENVANILALHDGAVWGEVLGSLAALGYDTVWDCLPAAAVGAPHLRDRVFAVATDTDGARRPSGWQPEHSGNGWARHVADEDAADAASHPDAHPVRLQPAGEPRSGGPAVAGRAGEAAADAGQRRQPQLAPVDGTEPTRPDTHPVGRGVRVEWGSYDAAIRRWEAIHGSAPEPLVRRVDARDAARMERSRLSALGDGVQVQIGRIVGEYIVERERVRLAA